MVDDVIAERMFMVDGCEVFCRFFKPERDGSDFSCRYVIDWPDKAKARYVLGVDSIQALLLAMQSAHVDLLMVRKDDGASVIWLDRESLGLPLSQGLRDLDPDGYF
ncbi:hypothetical protein EDF56_1202 [Novosphingobium sp. PhB165]|uniref:DUF6968 family protein n=1 Tax=Novosphingobium sp. PhB165 TaxID=2485105 RepID=UPI00104E3994|nr:hypothetical protein [Novosphingobium sp. PhB165]TCM12032.1 hypothetical protein EDF56_1202 [Novosphingobium sp. PhB165]